MLNKKISEIFNNDSIQVEELLFDYETFEEPPLYNFYDDINNIRKIIKDEYLEEFLLNLAISHINTTKIYAKNILSEEEYNKFFICITYDPFEEIFYPSFMVTRKKYLFKDILNYPKLDLTKNLVIKNALENLGILNSVSVFENKWLDKYCHEELTRIYIVYNSDLDFN